MSMVATGGSSGVSVSLVLNFCSAGAEKKTREREGGREGERQRGRQTEREPDSDAERQKDRAAGSKLWRMRTYASVRAIMSGSAVACQQSIHSVQVQ